MLILLFIGNAFKTYFAVCNSNKIILFIIIIISLSLEKLSRWKLKKEKLY